MKQYKYYYKLGAKHKYKDERPQQYATINTNISKEEIIELEKLIWPTYTEKDWEIICVDVELGLIKYSHFLSLCNYVVQSEELLLVLKKFPQYFEEIKSGRKDDSLIGEDNSLILDTYDDTINNLIVRDILE